MLQIVEGKPGSGKSYYAVMQTIEALKQGRKVYTNLSLNLSTIRERFGVEYAERVVLLEDDFFHFKKKTELERSDLERFNGALRLRTDSSYYWWNRFENNSLIIIDEIQRLLMKADDELEQPLTDYFSKHRHRRQDWIFITQHLTGLSLIVRRNVERVLIVKNLKQQNLPFPLMIKGQDLHDFLLAFGVDRQLMSIRSGLLEGTSRVRYDDAAEVITLKDDIYSLYQTHTLSTPGAKSDHPLPYSEAGNVKLNASLWLLKKYLPGVTIRIGAIVLAIILLFKLVFALPGFLMTTVSGAHKARPSASSSLPDEPSEEAPAVEFPAETLETQEHPQSVPILQPLNIQSPDPIPKIIEGGGVVVRAGQVLYSFGDPRRREMVGTDGQILYIERNALPASVNSERMQDDGDCADSGPAVGGIFNLR